MKSLEFLKIKETPKYKNMCIGNGVIYLQDACIVLDNICAMEILLPSALFPGFGILCFFAGIIGSFAPIDILKYPAEIAGTGRKRPAKDLYRSYISLLKELADTEYHQIEALDLTSVAGEAYASPEDEICAEVDVSFSYRIAYSYLDSWEEVRKKDTCDGEDELTFYYIPENGKWSLGNLGCHSLYY